MGSEIIQQDIDNPVGISEEIMESGESNDVINYNEIMQQIHFIGNLSLAAIIENIKIQFIDYINIEDMTNYVSIFYKQLADSYDALNNDESEEYPEEVKIGLDNIHDIFINNMIHLFENRLFISIPDIENINRADLEFIIQRTYEYFILNAKNNFKTVVSTSINGMILENVDDDEYFQQLQSLMELFSPLIQKVTPIEFLQLTGDQEIFNLFNSCQITGNFLRKYTPKLYQNEIFAMEIVNYTTMARLFKKELDAPLTPEERNIIYKYN